MSGYWNRDAARTGREPFTAYCEEHLPLERPAAWQVISDGRENPPANLREYLRDTFGGTEHCADYRNGRAEEYGGRQAFRDHARRMSLPMTPCGFAWTGGIGGSVGAPCAVCGRDC